MSDLGKVAEYIVEDFYNGRFDLSERGNISAPSSWPTLPQVECTQYLRDANASDRTILLYLTFISAIDRAKNSERCWWNGLELYESHPEVYDPLHLLQVSVDQLTEYLQECGVSQNTEQDPQAWLDIAQTITFESSCPVSRVIYGKTVDAKQLLKDLSTRGEEGRNRFPLLSGAKTGRKWVHMLASPGGAKITHIDFLPVTVDAHVRLATENLNIAKKDRAVTSDDAHYIQSVWRSAVNLMQLEEPDDVRDTCAGLDPALSFFGRFGCGHCNKVGAPVRLGRACNYCKLFR